MQHLDIIILSTIVTTLFVVFGIYTYKEVKTISSDDYKPQKEDTSPRANMIRFVGGLFEESSTKKMNPRQKAMLYSSVKRTIADMESDGVYFPLEVKEELKAKREELVCNYSDLPSVMSYLEEEDFHHGHS